MKDLCVVLFLTSFRQAGIPEQQLTLAYEPEAAAVFCKESKIKKKQKAGQKAELLSLGAGSKFMIVDLGGWCCFTG